MKIVGFFFVICCLNFSAQALESRPDLQISPAIGLGVDTLHMQVEAPHKSYLYQGTNQNFYFLNLGVNGYNLSVKFPYPDPEESRRTKVDSKITDYQFYFPVLKNWIAEFYLQKFQGYYVEDESFIFKLPDLGMTHYGSQVFYIFNPDYSYAATGSTELGTKKDAGSWILSLGYDQFQIEGDPTPNEMDSGLHSSLKHVNVDSVSTRLSYGKNWFWRKFYAGAAGGYGFNMNYYRYQYPDKDGKASNVRGTTQVAACGGYRFDAEQSFGMFVKAYSWSIDFDDKVISAEVTATGIFYRNVF